MPKKGQTSDIPEAPVLEIPALEVDEDIKRYPGFMQYLYQKKLLGAANLTKSEGLEKEIQVWTFKESQATEELSKL